MLHYFGIGNILLRTIYGLHEYIVISTHGKLVRFNHVIGLSLRSRGALQQSTGSPPGSEFGAIAQRVQNLALNF